MKRAQPRKRHSPPINFDDWEWGSFDELNQLISKRVAEALTEEMNEEGAYMAISSTDEPLTIISGWPFGDTFFEVNLRELMLELVEDYRPGGEGSGKPIADDKGEIAAQIAALRQLADDMEKLVGAK